jgi:hypothetical protein
MMFKIRQLIICAALLAGAPASAEPSFGWHLWENDDVGRTSTAEWTTSCGGNDYRIQLMRSDEGKNTYSILRNGVSISDEVDQFVSRNTSFFKEYNWLESIYCGVGVDRSGPEDVQENVVQFNFFGISRLPHNELKRFDGIKYNAYRYTVSIENDHIRGQVRYNLSDKIVSDLPAYLDAQDYDEAVPGTVLSPNYCLGGPPCPEFTGENAPEDAEQPED